MSTLKELLSKAVDAQASDVHIKPGQAPMRMAVKCEVEI